MSIRGAKGRWSGRKRIATYLAELPDGAEVKVVFGNHWARIPGWLVLKQQHQDITKRLGFADASVDVIFTEHVVEHVPFSDALRFFKEALRVLKPGGTLRTVTPMLDTMLDADLADPRADDYFQTAYMPCYPDAEPLLREIGLTPDRRLFMLNGVMREFEHKFIWTTSYMVEVLRGVGFRQADVVPIGQGAQADYCIERRLRCDNVTKDWQEEFASPEVFDLECAVVEARK